VAPDGATPVTAVLSTASDRAFVTYLPPAAAAEPPDVAALLRSTGARHLHVAGFPSAMAAPDVVAVAHAEGATVSFDPGWDERALADPRVRQVAMTADLLLPNRLEAALLTSLADADAATSLRALAALRPGRTTVVKDGADGAWGADDRGVVHVPAPAVAAVDPTGAGDVFDAGFLDAWWGSAALADCLARGAACGALATTAYGGATAAPTRAALEGRT
jgi:sugar/nucleoside kinase (ribokinase family)